MILSKKKIGLISIVLFFSFIASCNLSANSPGKYKVEYRVVTEKNSEFYKKAGLECIFYNSFPKTVRQFILQFYLCDEEGVPFSNPMYEVNCEIGNMEYSHFFLNLDEYLEDFHKQIDNQHIFADMAYASEIIFEDGSTWSDPFGLKYLTMEASR